ncbi:hypothetical protein [Streptomyces hirsutus]
MLLSVVMGGCCHTRFVCAPTSAPRTKAGLCNLITAIAVGLGVPSLYVVL